MAELKNSYAEYYFHQGTSCAAYEYLGSHISGDEIIFRTWAPNADAVCLAGDFNGWGSDLPLERITEGGIWAVSVKKDLIPIGGRYKYLIFRGDRSFFKSDPYAFWSETKINTASLLCDIGGYDWHDGEYLEKRKAWKDELYMDRSPSVPVNIYEVHLGSWKKHEDGSHLTYRELADELSEYVSDMGYTHIEIMPIAEHPFDGSWGYQVCGYYAPTSRFGSPKEFMEFIDIFHQKGIGVILDWVPSHFPKDAHGLYEFDGSPLYEYQGEDRMEHKSWGTRCFDVGRTEVRSFLISNAVFWLKEYHIDGLRVDAVASMLYLDYDRKPGEWNPNPDGSNISRESVSFFELLNKTVKERFPDVLMIAEESTAFPNVTKRHGLGFNMKWNMGWMNDTLSYMQTDTYFRPGSHHKMTFSTSYAYSESYVLPISHDEVVHGKKSLIDKMFGSYEQKFASLRAYLGWMYAHPGKKLLFMGSEFGQFREWDYETQLEWFMLDYPLHSELRDYVRSLNKFYLASPELWERDSDYYGFEWIDANRTNDSVYLFERAANDGSRLVCAFNFSPVHRGIYPIPVKEAGWYREVFASELGSNPKALRAKKNENGYVLTTELPPLSACFFRKTKKTK